MSPKRQIHEPGHRRKFLVIVDETPECDRAVYYASRRAARTGSGLVMLGILELAEVRQQWLGVADLMRAEATEAMQERLDHFSARARQISGVAAEHAIREGPQDEALLAQIAEDRDIAVLVLAAGTDTEGPGPLVGLLAGPASARFPVPVTIVPGALSDEDLDALA
ncbi:universal stress protein [Aquabacter spiritensis]|uniref:Nucleotide-binding universal stress UspA family protein n=1 Tax=Aquabacter spiritensis TaxID=933073 RepID=A0A4R3LZS4_9HYPH|nr:universal stress protein [Aquabacter spiritensis]TCT05963.1 nucleotide-binding universal stress UspA family protein [Aquabacter spiritensis]